MPYASRSFNHKSKELHMARLAMMAKLRKPRTNRPTPERKKTRQWLDDLAATEAVDSDTSAYSTAPDTASRTYDQPIRVEELTRRRRTRSTRGSPTTSISNPRPRSHLKSTHIALRYRSRPVHIHAPPIAPLLRPVANTLVALADRSHTVWKV